MAARDQKDCTHLKHVVPHNHAYARFNEFSLIDDVKI